MKNLVGSISSLPVSISGIGPTSIKFRLSLLCGRVVRLNTFRRSMFCRPFTHSIALCCTLSRILLSLTIASPTLGRNIPNAVSHTSCIQCGEILFVSLGKISFNHP